MIYWYIKNCIDAFLRYNGTSSYHLISICSYSVTVAYSPHCTQLTFSWSRGSTLPPLPLPDDNDCWPPEDVLLWEGEYEEGLLEDDIGGPPPICSEETIIQYTAEHFNVHKLLIPTMNISHHMTSLHIYMLNHTWYSLIRH